MSWKDKAVALYRRLGAPVKFAAKLVLGAALPGGSAVVDLVGQLLDCVHETAKDQIELDEAQAPAAAEADLKRVEEMFDVLSGDLAALTAQAAALEKVPDAAAEMVRVALATDERCRAALHKLDDLARGFGRIEKGVADINAKIDELLRRNNVPPGCQPQYHVSITDERERALLLHLKAEYRKLPPEQRRAVDLNKLGDALRGAGLAAEARDTYVEAAGATADRVAQAAAHYKEYFVELEQRHWDEALAAVLKAAALDGRLAPFPLHDYSPQRILGAGGFGAAFLCRDPHMEQDVVVKALHEADLDRSLKDVFAEAKVLLQLSRTHPTIIGVHRCGYADAAARARPYIVLDYFPGPSLQAYLDALPSPLGLPLPDFLAVVRPIAEGMRAAHAQGVWHRDLKPDNVLVHREGDRWDVRLIDFGLAVRGRIVRSSVTRPAYERSLFGASIAGTAKYAPPEQMGELPNEKVGPYSDVYAFGKLCLYTLFRTTEPKARHWKAVPDEARDGLREMLEKCTEYMPADRPASFETVVQELEAMGRTKEDIPFAELADEVAVPPAAGPVEDAASPSGEHFWTRPPAAAQQTEGVDTQGYVLESKALANVKQMIETFGLLDGQIDESHFRDAVATLVREMRGKKNDVQCKRTVIDIIQEAAFRVKQDRANRWFDKVKKQVGLG